MEQVLSTASHMREFNLLSNKMLRKVASFLPRASTMDAPTLSMFAMVLFSEEMQNAASIKDKEFSTFENVLLNNLENFNQLELSMILNTANNGSTHVDRILVESKDKIQELFVNDEFEFVTDLVIVAQAYLSRMDDLELDETFVNDLELAVLKRTTMLSAEQCVELSLLFSSFGSTELYECFDKIVGKGIDELTPDLYIDGLIGFMSV